jgi:hypothetical protein
VSITGVARFIYVSCEWPLDRDIDDWFHFDMQVPNDEFESCVTALTDSGTGSISTREGKQCSFIARPDGLFALEMTNGAGPFRKVLYLDKVGKIVDLPRS